MHASVKRVLFWAPRILCILFAIFLSVFALDVFSEGYGFWQTIGALLLHLVPTFIVVIALLIGWRHLIFYLTYSSSYSMPNDGRQM